MKLHALRERGGFLDPALYNWLRREGQQDGVVYAGPVVKVRGVELTFQHPLEAPPEGTGVKIWLGTTSVVCTTLAEVLEAKRADLAALAEYEQQQRAEEARRAAAAFAFNATLRIGVPWDTQIKHVLAGLTERSAGDGCSRATVVHIQLHAPLCVGRLKRERGWLLCASSLAANGSWRELASPNNPTRYGLYGEDYPPAVTCQKCLALARRLAALDSAAVPV